MSGADIARTSSATRARASRSRDGHGVDVDHPAFGGDGVARKNSPLFPSARVAYGYDFVGDAFNADPDFGDLQPGPDPGSESGRLQRSWHARRRHHRRQLRRGLKGVAPDVTFGAYRVFGCDGSTTADIMIAAMERALADGMQVLNMSIGCSFQWPQYPTAVAASRLVDRGMVVVASIGNAGTSGLYAAGAPGLGEKSSVRLRSTTSPSPVGVLSFTRCQGNRLQPVPPGRRSRPRHLPLPGLETVDNYERRLRRIAGRQPRWKDRPDPSRDLRFLHQVGERPECGRGCSRPVQQCSRSVESRPLPEPGDYDPGGHHHSCGRHYDRRPPCCRPGQPDLGRRTVTNAEPDRQPDLEFQLLRPVAGPRAQARHRRAGGNIWSTYPIELGGYANSERHFDGLPARGGRGRPAAAGQAEDQGRRCPDDPAEQRGSKDVVGRPRGSDTSTMSTARAQAWSTSTTRSLPRRGVPGKISLGEGEAGPRTQMLTITNSGASPVTYDLSS